jgi:hypothetical protein
MIMVSKLGGPFIPVPRWVLEYIKKDAVALHVLVQALMYLNSETQELTTSYDHLSTMTGHSRRTVIRAMHRLSEIGVIKRTQRYGKSGKNLSNRYVIDFNNPNALLNGRGVTGDTRVFSGVTGDTPRVSRVTPLSGVTGDTQSRKNNLNQERGQRGKKKKISELDLYTTDPKWQHQKKLSERNDPT